MIGAFGGANPEWNVRSRVIDPFGLAMGFDFLLLALS